MFDTMPDVVERTNAQAAGARLVGVHVLAESDLELLQLSEVEQRLGACRRARARLGGYEATLTRVVERLRQHQGPDLSDPEPEPDADSEPPAPATPALDGPTP